MTPNQKLLESLLGSPAEVKIKQNAKTLSTIIHSRGIPIYSEVAGTLDKAGEMFGVISPSIKVWFKHEVVTHISVDDNVVSITCNNP